MLYNSYLRSLSTFFEQRRSTARQRGVGLPLRRRVVAHGPAVSSATRSTLWDGATTPGWAVVACTRSATCEGAVDAIDHLGIKRPLRRRGGCPHLPPVMYRRVARRACATGSPPSRVRGTCAATLGTRSTRARGHEHASPNDVACSRSARRAQTHVSRSDHTPRRCDDTPHSAREVATRRYASLPVTNL